MIQTQLKANVFESLIRIWIVTFPRDVVFGSGFPSRSFFFRGGPRVLRADTGGDRGRLTCSDGVSFASTMKNENTPVSTVP